MSTAPTRPISPLELADATMEFVLAFDAWMKKASQASAGESIARLRLLYELHCNGPRKMADLAGSLGVTPRNVTALVDALEGDHQVRRLAHPTDRRITIVEISGGSATVEHQVDALRRAIADLFAGASEADRDAFARVLEKISSEIEPHRIAAPTA
jgi:DNA-binding MarR family transcriptional regulator